jgi:hypothetical protein
MAGMLVNNALLDACKYYLVNALDELAQFNQSLFVFSALD